MHAYNYRPIDTATTTPALEISFNICTIDRFLTVLNKSVPIGTLVSTSSVITQNEDLVIEKRA